MTRETCYHVVSWTIDGKLWLIILCPFQLKPQHHTISSFKRVIQLFDLVASAIC